MSDKQRLVALTLAHRWWGFAPEIIKALAEQDGLELRPSAWGAAIGRRDLRRALSRRSIPIPAGLQEWPRVLVAAEAMDGLKAVFDALDEAYPDAGVRLAHDGDHAARELDAFKPHLLIVDFGAPRFDAAEVCRRSRFSPAFPVTKVIALNCDEAGRELLQREGAACLEGRFNSDDVATAAAKLLSDEEAPLTPTLPQSTTGLARLFVWR